MKLRLRPLLWLTLLVALTLFVFVLFIVTRPIKLPPLPNPNGYDDLLKAGVSISGNTSDASEMNIESLRAFIATNTESLRLARVGLAKTCSVPTAQALTNLTGQMKDLAALKHLAHLLAVEGRLSEMEARTNDAAHSYLDAMRLGNEISHGGFLIHRLVGAACEAIGYGHLEILASSLKPEEAQQVLKELEHLDRVAVTWSEVVACERIFTRQQMFARKNPIIWIREWWSDRNAVRAAQLRHKITETKRRLLCSELAIRCYKSEAGRPPDGLGRLVPKYVSRVPTDPFSLRPMIYKAQGTNWLLYSVGPDGRDDGGVPGGGVTIGILPTSSGVLAGDLFFDSP